MSRGLALARDLSQSGQMHGYKFPLARRGQVIGLLGGSFDPPHAGHVHITRAALKRFGLDQVWWLVSPANPLKPDAPAALTRRLLAARAVMTHPQVAVTDLEAQLGTRFTLQTIQALRRSYVGVRFVWLMGADNLAGFHHWDNWQKIMRTVPVGVLARPSQGLRAGLSPAARMFARARVDQGAAHGIGLRPAPAWAFATIPLHRASSTAIRAQGNWR